LSSSKAISTSEDWELIINSLFTLIYLYDSASPETMIPLMFKGESRKVIIEEEKTGT
jgi:hypothetical protein